MYRQRETNPHFLPHDHDTVIDFPRQPQPRPPRQPPRHQRGGPSSRPLPPQPQPHAKPQPQGESSPHFTVLPTVPIPQQHPGPAQHPNDHGYSGHDPTDHDHVGHHPTQHGPAGHRPTDHGHGHSGQHPTSHGRGGHHPTQHGHAGRHHPTQHDQKDHHSSLLRVPSSRKTRPVAWLIAAFCALFWILVIVGGLIILIIYLVFRPRSPKFDISGTTLNAAYLDMGYLLNADLTVLTNFTNPNTKVNVDYSYIVFDLFYGENLIATRSIRPFYERRSESRFADVHMVASQVRLSTGHSLQLIREIESGRVNFEIRGLFRARSKLGGFLQYSYWLHTHCQIVVTGPPTGVLIGKKCTTKR